MKIRRRDWHFALLTAIPCKPRDYLHTYERWQLHITCRHFENNKKLFPLLCRVFSKLYCIILTIFKFYTLHILFCSYFLAFFIFLWIVHFLFMKKILWKFLLCKAFFVFWFILFDVSLFRFIFSFFSNLLFFLLFLCAILFYFVFFTSFFLNFLSHLFISFISKLASSHFSFFLSFQFPFENNYNNDERRCRKILAGSLLLWHADN